jgi:glycosyltransferase involved in cell wall biosynthesis
MQGSEQVRISVIIPVLDAEAYIAQTLRSALNQTTPPDEIIVVDNGSRDASAAIARGFGGIVRTTEAPEGGAASARNAGAALATGDALMFLDADDLLGPTAIEELSAALGERPGAVACCPWMRYELIDGCWLASPASCAPRRRHHDDLAAWLVGWYHPPCAVLWSRSAFDASGGWDPQGSVNDDGDLMMRAFASGIPLVRTSGGTSYYRRLPGDAVSLSGRRRTRAGLEARLRVLDRLVERLTQAGRIARYRAPLAEAYADILQDCGGEVQDLADRARTAVRLHGGFSRLRRAFRTIGHASARRLPGGGMLAPVASPRPAPDRAEIDEGNPLVSVVVPTYNRADLLKRAVDSVLSQSYENFELLVVDDGSTDDTAALVAGLDDPRLRYLRQPRNMGVAAARNRGMREARGSLVAFLDSDDLWAPEKLKRQVELIRRRPSKVGLFYTGLTVLDDEDRSTDWIPTARGDVWRAMLHDNVVHYGTSSTIIRREVIETIGYFDEKLPANEDYDYWTRLARFFEIDFVPAPLMTYNAKTAGEADERRSRNFIANMTARKMYVQRHGDDALRAGVRHLSFLNSARRHLESPDGSAREARWLLAKALRDRPTEPRLYMWLAFAMLPRNPRSRLAPGLKALRPLLPRRLWFGAGNAA